MGHACRTCCCHCTELPHSQIEQRATVPQKEMENHLVEQEVGVYLVLHQVGAAGGAGRLVFEVRADALEAKGVATGRSKRVLDGLYADGARQVLGVEQGCCCCRSGSSSATRRCVCAVHVCGVVGAPAAAAGIRWWVQSYACNWVAALIHGGRGNARRSSLLLLLLLCGESRG